MDPNKVTKNLANVLDNQNVSNVVKNVSLFSYILQLIKFLPFALIAIAVLVYLVSRGLPWYIAGFFILFFLFMLFLLIRNIKATAAIDLNKTSIHQPSKIGILVDTDEQIIALIAGILKTGFGIRSSGSFTGPAQANINDPQNAIILTNKHVHFIYVPIPGGDQVIGIGGLDLGVFDFALQRNNILQKLNQMFSTMTLLQILQSDDRNFSISNINIQKVTASDLQHAITFITNDNQKFSYSIRDNGDYQKLKQTFHL